MLPSLSIKPYKAYVKQLENGVGIKTIDKNGDENVIIITLKSTVNSSENLSTLSILGKFKKEKTSVATTKKDFARNEILTELGPHVKEPNSDTPEFGFFEDTSLYCVNNVLGSAVILVANTTLIKEKSYIFQGHLKNINGISLKRKNEKIKYKTKPILKPLAVCFGDYALYINLCSDQLLKNTNKSRGTQTDKECLLIDSKVVYHSSIETHLQTSIGKEDTGTQTDTPPTLVPHSTQTIRNSSIQDCFTQTEIVVLYNSVTSTTELNKENEINLGKYFSETTTDDNKMDVVSLKSVNVFTENVLHLQNESSACSLKTFDSHYLSKDLSDRSISGNLKQNSVTKFKKFKNSNTPLLLEDEKESLDIHMLQTVRSSPTMSIRQIKQHLNEVTKSLHKLFLAIEYLESFDSETSFQERTHEFTFSSINSGLANGINKSEMSLESLSEVQKENITSESSLCDRCGLLYFSTIISERHVCDVFGEHQYVSYSSQCNFINRPEGKLLTSKTGKHEFNGSFFYNDTLVGVSKPDQLTIHHCKGIHHSIHHCKGISCFGGSVMNDSCLNFKVTEDEDKDVVDIEESKVFYNTKYSYMTITEEGSQNSDNFINVVSSNNNHNINSRKDLSKVSGKLLNHNVGDDNTVIDRDKKRIADLNQSYRRFSKSKRTNTINSNEKIIENQVYSEDVLPIVPIEESKYSTDELKNPLLNITSSASDGNKLASITRTHVGNTTFGNTSILSTKEREKVNSWLELKTIESTNSETYRHLLNNKQSQNWQKTSVGDNSLSGVIGLFNNKSRFLISEDSSNSLHISEVTEDEGSTKVTDKNNSSIAILSIPNLIQNKYDLYSKEHRSKSEGFEEIKEISKETPDLNRNSELSVRLQDVIHVKAEEKAQIEQLKTTRTRVMSVNIEDQCFKTRKLKTKSSKRKLRKIFCLGI